MNIKKILLSGLVLLLASSCNSYSNLESSKKMEEKDETVINVNENYQEQKNDESINAEIDSNDDIVEINQKDQTVIKNNKSNSINRC